MSVIRADFESRKIPGIYLGAPDGAECDDRAPLRGPFEAEIFQFQSASSSQPFASSAALLFALGYGPMPESANKIPCFGGWSDYYPGKVRLPDDIRGLIAKYPRARLSVVCGHGNLLAIDIDTDDEDKIDAILHTLPAWTVAKRGSKGLTIFFRYTGDLERDCNRRFRLKGADGKEGDVFCEVLWTGRKTTIPPTPHAKTQSPYIWVNGEHTLLNTPVGKLPEITAAHLEALQAAIKPWTYQRPQPQRERSNFDPKKIVKSRYEAWYRAGLNNAKSRLSGMTEGRPTELFRSVCALGAGVHHGFLSRYEFESAFVEACNHNGLQDREGRNAIFATISSGLSLSQDDELPDLGDQSRRQAKDKPNGPKADEDALDGGTGPQPDGGEAKLRAGIERLASLSKAQWALIDKEAEADALGINIPDLKSLVKEARDAAAKERKAAEKAARRAQPQVDGEGVSLTDFYAVLPTHQYLFVPTRALWPAESINSLFGDDDEVSPSTELDQTRGVQAMTWAPGFPLIIENRLVCEAGWIDRPRCRTLNLYRPPAIGDDGDPNDVEPWLNHVRKIYPERTERLLDFLAHPVQRPQVKINHALVLAGPPGIGKDTAIEPLKYAVGPWNFHEVSPKQLMGRFNPFLKSVILRVSEARDLGDVDRYAFYETTKTMWAAPPDMLTVDEKNLKTHPIVNVLAGIITTNHRTDGLYLPADDRRHFVLWSNMTKDDLAFAGGYWKDLWGWYHGEGGIENVAAFLKARDLSGFNPKEAPPQTTAFWAMVDNARSPEEAELYDELEKLGWPDAITLEQVIMAATDLIGGWLSDRKNRPSIPHKFDRCGYIALRNKDTTDGRWKIGGKNRVIYVRKVLSGQAQHVAATKLRDEG